MTLENHISSAVEKAVERVLREKLPEIIRQVSERERKKYISTAEVLERLGVSRSWWAAAIREHSQVQRHARKANTRSHYWPAALIEEIYLAGNDLIEGERAYREKNEES